jgi:hypothetical protein
MLQLPGEGTDYGSAFIVYKSNPSSLLGCVLIAISCLSGTESAMAAERTPDPSGPPSTYHIDSVSIRLALHPGRGGKSVQSLSLSGNGEATVKRDGKLLQFPYPRDDFLNLLNEFYRIRFFDLPKTYAIRYSMFLKEDGMVAMSALKMPDVPSTQVCIVIEEYEKCVMFGRDGPSELKSIAQTLLEVIESER